MGNEAARTGGAFLLAVVLGLAWKARADDPLKLEVLKHGRTAVFVAVNRDPWAPWHGRLDFPLLNNMKASAPLPARVVVGPGGRAEVCSLSPLDPSRGGGYESSFLTGMGDPDARPDSSFAYVFPWQNGLKHLVIQGYFGPYTHQDCRCLDFDLAEGSPICAARGGVVVKVKQDSNTGGPGPQFEPWANVVEILHSDGTWATYAHLRWHGARVRVGQRVKRGQVIGFSGHTGQADGPHLHFEVDKATWGRETGVETLPTLFLRQDAPPVLAQAGHYYYSFHPGMPRFREVLASRITDADYAGWSRPCRRGRGVFVRREKVDNKVFLFGDNATGREETLTLRFPLLENFTASRPLPFSRSVPAHTEVFLFSLTSDPTQASSYRMEYSY